MITSRDAVMILDKNGFRIPNAGLDRYGKITYNNERVGTLYEDEIYLASEFPHLRNNSYADTPKTILMFTRPMTELEKAIEFLLDSPRRIDRETRDKRVEDVRKYFKEQELKRLRRNELLSSVERGEHLSREELRELSAMGYTI